MRTHSYPAHFYGPNGQSAVFHREEDVPVHWHDHPSKVVTPEKTGSKPLGVDTDKIPAPQRGSGPANPGDVSNTLDAHGHPWDAKLHAATQTKTKDGLWRMRVGVSRPAPKPGYPKPPLDL